jgi:hypothetical protein
MVRIQYNRPSIYKCGALRLVGGVNAVDDAAYKKASTHPGFAARVATGQIVVLGSTAAPTVKAAASSADDSAALLADIPGMFDTVRLNEIADGDNVTLAEAAFNRLEELYLEAEKREAAAAGEEPGDESAKPKGRKTKSKE